MTAKILIIEDEPDMADLIALNLKTAGYKALVAGNGETGLAKARAEIPDLIILDLMLPKLSGTEVCKLLKNDPATAAIPVIMLTAKGDEMDRILGLELGAEDYVTKPFSPRELALRIRTVLRRRQPDAKKQERFKHGILTLDQAKHEVLIGDKFLDLTTIEFNLLALLLERKGRVQSRERLLNDVWGYEVAIDSRTVDTHVRRLREKMGKAADYIETVRGIGYRMAETV